MSDVTGAYYAGDAFHGFGTELLVGDGASPEEFAAIADVTSITPGDMSTAVHDKSHLRSRNAHREKLAGMRDSGPFVITGNWRPRHESQSNGTTQAVEGYVGSGGAELGALGAAASSFAQGGLLAFSIDRQPRNFIIRLPLATPLDWPFRGIVTKFQPGQIGLDDKTGFTAEITPESDFSGDLP